MTTSAETIAPFSLQVLFDAGNSSADATSDVCNQALAHAYCLAALQAQNLLDLQQVTQIEVSVQIVERDVMQALNLQYRHKDAATNILSFKSGLPVMPLNGDVHHGGLLVLGDLVLCKDIIASEAFDQSKSEVAHWAHMLVHGILHLCGYDHEDADQADAMESLEIQILSRAGIADPYGADE